MKNWCIRWRIIITILIFFATIRTASAAQQPEHSTIKIGDIIKFGSYEQDNDTDNGAEAIEWRVLDIDANSALIVSVMGLDAMPYHDEDEVTAYENSSLRKWLNAAFYAEAFTEAEQGVIELTDVVNTDNSNYGTDGGTDTKDNIFLLSLMEIERYFPDRKDRTLKPTAYAIANGAWTNKDGNSWEWLRSPGNNRRYAAAIDADGYVSYYGFYFLFPNFTVRPALRINLESMDF